MNDEIIRHFETTWKEYDAWYDRHPALYRTELAALQRVVPSGMGLEIGVGTGRFAAPLGVGFGLDPAIRMLRLAKERGLLVARGRGERRSGCRNRFPARRRAPGSPRPIGDGLDPVSRAVLDSVAAKPYGQPGSRFPPSKFPRQPLEPPRRGGVF